MSAAGVVKRSLAIAGHRTSVSLEAPFWEALKEIAARRRMSLQALVEAIDAERGGQNLSSAIRVFVLRDALAQPRGGSGSMGVGSNSGGV